MLSGRAVAQPELLMSFLLMSFGAASPREAMHHSATACPMTGSVPNMPGR
jgi:hypothetical protein